MTGRVVLTAGAAITAVGLVAWALADGGAMAWGIPVVALCAALAFAINWIAFVPAFAARTERFYDLVGSLTFLSVTTTAMLAAGATGTRAVVLAVLVAIWAARLGLFLFRRVHADGGDGRFDAVKRSGPQFFLAWTLQAAWVFLTLAAALAAITTSATVPLGVWFWIGLAAWLTGFGIEVAADRQKRTFRRDGSRTTEFITSGLWSRSRHPNYFGEILLWIGIAIMAAPTFSDWQWVALISPVSVALLLVRGSGIPILEKRADERWGGQADYESYKARTPVLVPRLLRAPRSGPPS